MLPPPVTWVDRNVDRHACPVAGGSVDRDLAATKAQPLAYGKQTEPILQVLGHGRIEAAALVSYRHRRALPGARKRHPCAIGSGMLDDIKQQLPDGLEQQHAHVLVADAQSVARVDATSSVCTSAINETSRRTADVSPSSSSTAGSVEWCDPPSASCELIRSR
jgi:hypothetical protein